MVLNCFRRRDSSQAAAVKAASKQSCDSTTSTFVVDENHHGHDSVSIHIHNRTATEFLAQSVFGAVKANIKSQRVVSSSIPTSPNPGGEAVFGVCSTPVRIQARQTIKVPSIKIQHSTAAATSGYSVELTLNPRDNTLGTSALTATLTAPPAAQPVAVVAAKSKCTSKKRDSPKRVWEPLALSSTDGVVVKQDQQRQATSGSIGLQALHYTEASTNTIHVLLLPNVELSSWMSKLSDTGLLSSFCIPGTHETCALYGYLISTCQHASASIAYQLSRGIRFLDIRLSLIGQPGNQTLRAYHGVADQKIDFTNILSQVYAFLSANPSKGVVMSIMQENRTSGFQDAVFTQVNANRNAWYLETAIPKLVDIRGKIVLLSRFGSSDSQPGGIHPPIWPDSNPDPFTYLLPDGCKVVTQDWYDIGTLSNIPRKIALVNQCLDQSGADPNVLGINFTSGSSCPRALPAWVAKGTGDQRKAATGIGGWRDHLGVNALLVDILATRLVHAAQSHPAALMNIFALDFFDQDNLPADLATLIVHANFQ